MGINLEKQSAYAQMYSKNDIKRIKLANQIKSVMTLYIQYDTELQQYIEKNVWIYVVSCRLNPNNKTVHVHIGTNGDKDEIVKFFTDRVKQIKFYCSKKMERTHTMPDMMFHADSLVDEMLEWDRIKMNECAANEI